MNESKVVLVSGGSRGLGRSLVEHLLAADYRVATFSRSPPRRLEELQSGPYGERFLWQAADVTDEEGLRELVLALGRRYGRIDALINNAGMAVDGVLPLITPADIHRVIAVNFASAVHLARECSRVMLQQEEGVILNISSVAGLRGATGLSVYGATKAALDGLTRGLARELGPRGIRVNSVAPGYLETDMTAQLDARQQQRIIRRTPLRRLGTVDDVVELVLFLLSPRARFITGQTLVVDGGLSC